MSTPIVEQVAAALATEVATVTTANGYNYTIHTVRRFNRTHLKEVDIKPHLNCIIAQDRSVGLLEEEQGNPVIITLAYTFNVIVFISPSEDDTTAIDTYSNTVWADVVKAVMTSANTSGDDLYDLVRRWQVLDPEYLDPEQYGHHGVNCRFLAEIRTNETDPFTQR